MTDHDGRTVICSIVFMDVVAYSMATDEMQVAIKANLNVIIGDAVSRIPEADRIILDTGDGVALCLMGDPEDALFVATSVKEAVDQAPDEQTPTLRIGVNLGPVKLVTDLNGRRNVLGDGINVAQRVMSFAEENEILVSRSYYEVVARLRPGNERLFSYLGVKKDKHVREHQIYAFGMRGGEARAPTAADTAETPASAVLTPAILAEAERRLADLIGPLAGILTRRAGATSASIADLYKTIAAAIPDAADRDAFIASAPAQVATPPAVTETEGAAPATALTDTDLAVATATLAQVIGPFAATLVRQAAKQAVDRPDLYAKLARHIDDEAQRKAFLAAAEQTT